MAAPRSEQHSSTPEPPSFMFKQAAWDALTSIIYVVGALVVVLLTRLFGHEGLPLIVKIVMFSLEVGFIFVAVASVIRSLTLLVRDLKGLATELNVQAVRPILKRRPGSRDYVGMALRVLGSSLAVLICVLVGIYVQSSVAKVVIIALVAIGALLAAYMVWRNVRRSEIELQRERREAARHQFGEQPKLLISSVDVYKQFLSRWIEAMPGPFPLNYGLYCLMAAAVGVCLGSVIDLPDIVTRVVSLQDHP